MRIVSLVPSQTELLFDLGLSPYIVGVTKYCVHPEKAMLTCEIVGGTKTLDLPKIKALSPTLIIANKEENTREQIESLQANAKRDGYTLYISDILTLQDAYTMITTIGELTQTSQKANDLVADIALKFKKLRQKIKENSDGVKDSLIIKKRVAYFIWRKPYMIAARDTFIDAMLSEMGFENAFADLARYPNVTAAQIQNAQPDAIFLSSEPFPFREKHVEELKDICPTADVQIVDGEMFSWYGSRLLSAVDYFEKLYCFQL